MSDSDKSRESPLLYICLCVLITITGIAGMFGVTALGYSMSDAESHWTHTAGTLGSVIWVITHVFAFGTAFSRGIEKAW